jgi:hypothetical protein
VFELLLTTNKLSKHVCAHYFQFFAMAPQYTDEYNDGTIKRPSNI